MSVYPAKLLIVDKNELTRIGICAVLAQYDDLEVVGDAGDSETALALVQAHKPDLVLLDLMLPDCGGLGLCRDIRKVCQSAKIFVVSDCDDQQCMIQAFSFGVEGYLQKNVSQHELMDAIRRVLGGKAVIAPSIAEIVVEHLRDGGRSQSRHSVDLLSSQERRVLELVSKGMSNRQVADELKLSEKTVKNYFSSVLNKLSANRRTEAAAIYWEYQQNLQAVG